MADAAFCKRCGSVIGADVAQGLCPACLLEQGLGQGLGGDETAAMPAAGQAGGYAGQAGGYAGWTTGNAPPPGLPQPAELARLFPQLEIIELLGRGGMGV